MKNVLPSKNRSNIIRHQKTEAKKKKHKTISYLELNGLILLKDAFGNSHSLIPRLEMADANVSRRNSWQ